MLKIHKLAFNAPAIMLYLFICIAGLGAYYYFGSAVTDTFFRMSHPTDLSWEMVVRIFAHVFGYVDVKKLFWHGIILLAVGPMIEEKYMSQKVVTLMFAVAFLSSLPMFFWLKDATIMGGTGIVAGLVVLGSFTGDKDGSLPVSFLVISVALIIYGWSMIYMNPGDQQSIADAIEIFVGTAVGGFLIYR